MAYTYVARFRIKNGSEARFAALVERMIAATAANPDTLDYKVFTAADPRDFVFYESYTDEAADLAHRTGPVTGPIVAEMVECIDDAGFACEVWHPVASLPAAAEGRLHG